MRTVFRRVVTAMVATATVAGGLIVLTAGPALAGSTEITRSSWAYIDVREPRTTFAEGDAPVGAWRDDQGRLHSSKAYFTFDLSSLLGTRVDYVEARTAEVAANDCGTPRATEMWATESAERPTWTYQPRELGRLPDPLAPGGCLTSRLVWEATTAVREALAAGHTRLTLALRMPERLQFDVAYGRRHANSMRLGVLLNRPPSTPTELSPCGESLFLPTATPDMSARFADPDEGDRITGTFAIWPIDEPTRRTEMTVHASSGTRAFRTVAAGVLVDGGTYEWAVRAGDDTGTSDWSSPCRFTVDTSPPHTQPGVSSPDYPEDCQFPGCGGIGIPGQFTFTANGVADVVGYRYGESDTPLNFVAADELSGDATVTIVPTDSFIRRLKVRSVDRAGNQSPTREYAYWVRDNRPIISCVPEHGMLAERRECTFTPGMAGVTSYRYRFENGPESTISADAEGNATVTIRPTTFHPMLDVTSVTEDGFEVTRNRFILMAPSDPDVTSETYPEGPFEYGGGVGIAGEFRFSPRMADVAEYVYQFDDEPEVVVAADADGTATITYTPTTPEGHVLLVSSRTADGITSEQTSYFFLVNPTR